MFFRPKNPLVTDSGQVSLYDWLSRDKTFHLDSNLTTDREDYIYPNDIRSKFFVWTKAAVMMGIHFPYELIDNDKRVRTVYVDERTALVHHYRQWSNLDNPQRKPRIITDRWMDRYVEEIAAAVDRRRLSTIELVWLREYRKNNSKTS